MPNQIEDGKKEASAVTTDFKARRRLLKASAAAPLIATLAPNAALAQGSLMCAQRGLDDVALQNAPGVVSTDDNAVRVLGTCWTRTRPSDGELITRYEVPKASGNYFRPNGRPVNNPNFSTRRFDGEDCYFLQYFNVLSDGSAQAVGAFPATSSGDVIAESCWTSITVAGQFRID